MKDVMKKLSAILFCVCTIVFIVGCGAGAKTPTQTVKEFLTAVINNDVEAMSKVATQETVQLMAMFGTKAQEALSEQGFADMNQFTFVEAIDGDTATVTMQDSNGEEGETLDLVKVDGKWMVSINMNK